MLLTLSVHHSRFYLYLIVIMINRYFKEAKYANIINFKDKESDRDPGSAVLQTPAKYCSLVTKYKSTIRNKIALSIRSIITNTQGVSP